MPTIKKTGIGSELRIITKVVNAERRVSCSCCEEAGCCMYPADQLSIGYLQADLPDALEINWTGQFTGAVTISGNQYTSGSVTLKRNEAATSWVLEDSSTNSKTTRSVGRCLIKGDGNLTPGDDLVEDNFEDVYDVTISGAGGTLFDGPVTRTSLCEWSGQAVNGTITTISLQYNPITYKWEVSGDRVSGPIILWQFNSESSGPQNQPNDRTYTNIISVPSNTVTTIVVTIP